MARAESRHGCGAFTLIELLVVIAIIALLITLLLPAMSSARRVARLAVCSANQRQMGVGGASYASDFKEYIYNYSWKAGVSPAIDPTLASATSDMDAQRNQYVDIFRNRAQRPLAQESTLLPQILYGHYVLMDFLAARLPEPIYTCPEDRVRLDWAANIDRYVAGGAPPYPSGVGTSFPIPAGDRDIRWAFSSTYEVTTGVFDPLQSSNLNLTSGPDISARVRNTTGNHFIYEGSPPSKLGLTLYSQVAFPTQKVHLYEAHARHAGRKQRYYGSPGAAVNLLFFDASVRYVNNKDANKGWDPRNPTAAQFQFLYVPDRWEPPTASGNSTEAVIGYYRYTRGGLKGVDVGSREINTGQAPVP